MLPHTPPADIEATPHLRIAEVLPLLNLGQQRTAHLRTAVEAGKVDTWGLFHAERDGRFVGAAWGQIIPGRTAFCWPPCIVASEPEETAICLQQAVDAHLDSCGIAVTQAVLRTRDITSADRLVRAGYRHLADVDYMSSSIPSEPREQSTCSLRFEPAAGQEDERMRTLIQQTYVQSRDCSQLDGVRNMEDVLTGYRQTAVYRPEWWIFATFGGEDVGCMLLADHPEHNRSELMYMGIVPRRRGRGWGFQLTRYAQCMMRQFNRSSILLAVDNANWPARAIYYRAGFRTWDRRRVYVRTPDAGGEQASR